MIYRSYKPYKSYKTYESSNFSGYKSLYFFQQSEIIFDFTVDFCKQYIDYKSRTNDQMIQAARSGKQNIAEGYLQKSLEGRIKLLGVARGSLEELLNDYLDFLRQRKLELWLKDSSLAKTVRNLAYKSYKSYDSYKSYLSSPESAANAIICLINQTNQLIDKKLQILEDDFIKQGGFRENLFRKRQEYRKNLLVK